jgi:hypothetical protein
MGTITRTNTFVNGTTASATEVNTELDTVYNEFNGNIENANIKADAAIAGSKLNLAVPGAIGGTTPSTGAFTTLSTSGLATLASAKITKREVTITSSATPTPNSDITDIYTITALAEAAAFGAPTGTPTQGQTLLYRIKDNGTARALDFSNAIYREGTDVIFPTTTILGKTLYVGLIYNSTDSKWDLLFVDDGF